MNISKQKVKIKISSQQKIAGISSDFVDHSAEGTLEHLADRIVVRYYEPEETGFSGALTTLTIFGNDAVTVTRLGGNELNVYFKEGRRHISSLLTPAGQFEIGVITRKVKVTKGLKGILVNLEYMMSAEGNPTIDIIMKFQIKY